MRSRSIATSAATLIAAASMTPLTARAAGQVILYVNGSSSACTDSGSGTLAAPFCTIQAAADATDPGDVVDVAQGSYNAFTITHSGTASAPIVFTGNGVWGPFGLASEATVTGLTLSGADNVEVEGFRVLPAEGTATTVDGGSEISLVNDLISPQTSTSGSSSLHITGAASAVTVRDSVVDYGLTVDGGSTGTILTTDKIFSDTSDAISLAGAENTAVTSDTITGCGTLVSVTGSSGTSIENNAVAGDETTDPNCPATATSYGISVDEGSASSTTSDYNDVYVTGDGSAAYDWDGTAYPSGAGLNAAAGQGEHDFNSAGSVVDEEGSPLINSANSAAIGEQALGFGGAPRVDDPLVTPTGAGPYAYYDRGAIQFQDPISLVKKNVTGPTQVPVGAEFTVGVAMTDTWSDHLEYQFVLGGGGTVLATDSSGNLTTSFPSDGYYNLEIEARPQGSTIPYTRVVGQDEINVVAPAPLTPQLITQAVGATGLDANTTDTTDAWNITGVTYNFGDGTPTVTETSEASVTHTYAKPGIYQVTAMMTDFDGDTATTTSTFTTGLPPAGALVDFAQAPEAPGDAIGFGPTPSASGVAQAAITTMPDGATNQYAAVTTTGGVEFTIVNTSTWQGWTTLSQPGVTAKSVSIAGMPDGSTQIIEVTSVGVLKHIVRNADGTWQSSGWGVPAGSTGIAQAAITAMPNGSSQLVAVTTNGTLVHNIRNANGSWQGWRPLSQPGVIVKDASIAGMNDGSSQIVEVTSTGILKHDIRNANGSWQASGWGRPGDPAGIAQASIAAMYGGVSEIVTVMNDGSTAYNVRNVNGSWAGWSGFNTEAGGGEAITSLSYVDLAGLSDGNSMVVAVSAG